MLLPNNYYCTPGMCPTSSSLIFISLSTSPQVTASRRMAVWVMPLAKEVYRSTTDMPSSSSYLDKGRLPSMIRRMKNNTKLGCISHSVFLFLFLHGGFFKVIIPRVYWPHTLNKSADILLGLTPGNNV